MRKTLSNVLVERLIDWGVDTVFGLPGDGINGIIEAFRENQHKIRFIQNRHEEASAFAACAYAKFTGRLGVCVATSGPGAIHLLNGLYDAKLDGAPVLAITGEQYSDLLGDSYQQVVNVLSLYEDLAAFNQQVESPTEVYNLVNRACRIALSQRTVVHLTIPIDRQVEEAQVQFLAHHGGPPKTPGDVTTFAPGFYSTDGRGSTTGQAVAMPRVPLADPVLVQHAADILNAGRKVAILAGHGALDARAELEEVADIRGAPIVKALLGKGAVPDDSPFSTGGLGLLGTRPSEDAMEQCDTLLIVGSSFPYARYLPKPGQARAVQIDIEQSRIGLRYPVEVGLVGDSYATLRALLPLLRRNSDRSFLEMAQRGMRSWNTMLEAEGTRMDVPMKPQVVAHALNKYAAPNAIIVGDSGANTTWIARNFMLRRDQMFSLSGNLATMAPGLPYALGAQVAHPNRQVIAFVGDGGFTMLMGEVLTAVKYNLPIKVIIMNNHYLAQIKWEQIVFLGNPEYVVDLQAADFAAWARAAGAQGIRVDDPAQIDQTMKEFLAIPGPAVLDCIVDPNEPPLPAKIKPEQALRFAEALARGTREGPRIALTAFRDKLDEVLEENATRGGVFGQALGRLGQILK
jgi:pyruvate dehydrogenase (quinone)